MALKSKFTKLRAITASVLQFRTNQPRVLMLLSPMYVGKKIEAKKDAATLMHVVDAETGEEGIILCSAVLRSQLTESYPKQSYVRKFFEFTKVKAAGDKVGEKTVAYNHFSISEVAAPDYDKDDAESVDYDKFQSVAPPPDAVLVTDETIAAERAKRLGEELPEDATGKTPPPPLPAGAAKARR